MQISFVSENPKAHHSPAVRALEDALDVECSCWRDVEGCRLHNVELLAELVTTRLQSAADTEAKLEELRGTLTERLEDMEGEIKRAQEQVKELADLGSGKTTVDPEEGQSDAEALLAELDDAACTLKDCLDDLEDARDALDIANDEAEPA